MKKPTTLVMLFLLIASLATIAMAEEHLTEEEEREARSIDEFHGAKARFLQLERAIKLKVEQGLRVVDFIEENYEASTETLEELLNDLEALGEKVAGTEIEGKTHEELATEYVALRREANSIIIEFRREASTIISSERLAEARARAEQARTEASERLEALRERAREEVHAHNEERLRQALEAMGETAEEIRERIEGRDITRAEAERIVRETFDEYTLEERRIAAQQLRERLQQMAQERVDALTQVREQYQERIDAVRAEIRAAAEDTERTMEALRQRISQEAITPPTSGFRVWFEDGVLYFEGTIDKPTPCYTLTVSSSATRSIPPQARTDVRMTVYEREICPQVVTPETIEGSIHTGYRPSSYTLYVNNQGLFRTADIPDRGGANNDRPATGAVR